eukprot:Hpha_TRINITY_DN10972_c0_g1::TRINITY_DN10972_c0_g1_i1::g.26913::m.26913/K01286/E3.4.16.4; D-alanyl-D-alanine carboxypeptidase
MKRAMLLGLVAGASCAGNHPDGAVLRSLLQPIAEREARKYNCSIVIAMRDTGGTVNVAAGTSDFGSGRPMRTDDVLSWGSGTKVLTGASIMQLASEGKVDLDAPAERYVDPFLAASAAASGGAQNFTSLRELYGPNVSFVTVRRLLSMRSGIPDFDTATPCYPQPCTPTDPLRKELYDNPAHNLSPIELMSLPWVAKDVILPPDTPEGAVYSSTNFMILGMILAQQRGWSVWDGLAQADYLPQHARAKYQHLTFGTHGAPAAFSAVHGYDRTSYNGNAGHSTDVYNVAGTFAGWTAADILGSASDLAEMVWDVYGPEQTMAPKEYIDQMIPTVPFYGLATFNLTGRTGREPPLGTAYGHLGANYGYQSIMSYHPELRISFAIGSNLETDYQQHPADTLCMAFTAVANFRRNETVACTYTPGSYWGGACACK